MLDKIIHILTQNAFASFLSTPCGAGPYIETLVLGPQREVAHGNSPSFEVTDSARLGEVLLGYPALVTVKCGNIRWPAVDVLSYPAGVSEVSCIYVVLPIWPMGVAADDRPSPPQAGVSHVHIRHDHLTVPANPFAWPTMMGGDEPSDVRVVQVYIIPLRTDTVLQLGDDVIAFREVLVRVGGRRALTDVGAVMEMAGGFIQDLTVRWDNLQETEDINGMFPVHNMPLVHSPLHSGRCASICRNGIMYLA